MPKTPDPDSSPLDLSPSDLSPLDLPTSDGSSSNGEGSTLAASCWQSIGVWGDGSCDALGNHIHCHNCSVYIDAGRNFLDRTASDTYIRTLSEQFSQAQEEYRQTFLAQQDTALLLIFRLRREWFALTGDLFRETAAPSPVHSIPHRTNKVLKGLVNVRGEMMLCVSLANLLELEGEAQDTQLLILELDHESWVFPVDELDGLQAIAKEQLSPPPATVTKGAATYAQSIFPWKGRPVTLLDGELLFYAIQRRSVP